MNPSCVQDELLSKKKKEKRRKLGSRPVEELRCIGQERSDRYSVIIGSTVYLVSLCLLLFVCLLF